MHISIYVPNFIPTLPLISPTPLPSLPLITTIPEMAGGIWEGEHPRHGSDAVAGRLKKHWQGVGGLKKNHGATILQCYWHENEAT